MKRTSKPPAVSAIPAPGYADWLQAFSRRYRQSQIKAAVAVNSEMLKFYFSLGADIVRMEKDQPWGSGFLARLSSDLRRAMPEAQSFSVTNLKYMRSFFKLYAPCLISHQSGGRLSEETIDGTLPAIGHQVGDQLSDTDPFKLICKTKDTTMVKWALESTQQPIGVSEYRISENLPKEVASDLPSIAEIESALPTVSQCPKLRSKRKS